MSSESSLQTGWHFDNSYARDLEGFYAPWQVEPTAAPKLLQFNSALADRLGLSHENISDSALAQILGGSVLPLGAEPIALAYAGHQFGHFNPQLGDGRALLLGELIAPDGARFDLQLKGSGRTPFSRNGDGRSAIGPALREYLVSEAMAALGVPTTRALSVVATGERVQRERAHPGAVLARVAASHIRIGTFQFFATHFGPDHVRQLADYTIERHYPAAANADHRYFALFEAALNAQVALVAKWTNLGFVHGVMNTDNVAINGETIDYGPCAFIDSYAPDAVFSSIDRQGRYAFGNQPFIARWNMAQLARAMLPVLVDEDPDAVDKVNALIGTFPERYIAAWLDGMRAKLGLASVEEGDADLASRLFKTMEGQNVDFTLFFRQLARVPDEGTGVVSRLFSDPQAADPWLDEWLARIDRDSIAKPDRQAAMDAVNPLYIPRNHMVEHALDAAEESNDLAPFERLLDVVRNPHGERPEWSDYAQPAPPAFSHYVTYCGT
ncbi:protein adenylyltransferase SelO [Tsuneonella suprasediminis]|uniref:protein adenylyltransferase SelO n=1 Tax=Tsuneonella suprasediminis TaxID=2306996 RepID=UPI002F9578D4